MLNKAMPASLMVSVVAAAATQASVRMGEISPWYKNQLVIEKGVSITSPAEAAQGYDLRTIVDPEQFPPPEGKERFVFADKNQHEIFTIDIGRVYKSGLLLVRVHPHDVTVHGNPGGRTPERMKIRVSADGSEKTWTTLRSWPEGKVPMRQSIIWEDRPVRYLRFDLGRNTDETGSRLGTIKLYKRYRQPPLKQRLRELSGLLKDDEQNLKPFRTALADHDLDAAVGALRQHFVNAPVKFYGGAPKHARRAEDWQRGTYRFDGRSWRLPEGIKDWYYFPFDLSHEPPSYWVAGHHFWYLPDWYTEHPETKYARYAAEMIGNWLVDVPCPGVHKIKGTGRANLVAGWEAIRVANRLGGLCRAAAVFAPERENFDDTTWVHLLFSIHEHAAFLAYVTPSLRGNWQTWANERLIMTACAYDEFKDHKNWLQVARQAFETQVMRDVSQDGKEMEDSTYYCLRGMREIINSYEYFEKADMSLDPKVVSRVKEALDFPAWVYQPDFRNPGIGDMGSVDEPNESIPLVDEYAAEWGRDDLVYINTHGEKGVKPEQTSRAFIDGYYIMRSTWEDDLDARHLIFHAPPVHRIGHGHRDQLAVVLYAYRRPLLIDPGMTIYGKAGSEHYRTTEMHNTVAVDGESQAFGPGSKDHHWESTSSYDYVEATHELFENFRHRRRVIFVKPDYYVIVDDLTGRGERQLDWNYHFLAGAAPAKDNGLIRTNFRQNGNLAILPVGGSRFDRNEPKTFKYVHGDGEIESTGWLLRKKTKLPQRLVTLLVPFDGPEVPELEAVSVADNVLKVRFTNRSDLVAWYPDARKGSWTLTAEGVNRCVKQAATVIRSTP